MGKGEKANVTCPDYLDVQRDTCPFTFNSSLNNSQSLCKSKNITYEFEVIECGPKEPSLAQVPKPSGLFEGSSAPTEPSSSPPVGLVREELPILP